MPREGGRARAIVNLIRRVAQWLAQFLAGQPRDERREETKSPSAEKTVPDNRSGVLGTTAITKAEPSSATNVVQAPGGYDKDVTAASDDISPPPTGDGGEERAAESEHRVVSPQMNESGDKSATSGTASPPNDQQQGVPPDDGIQQTPDRKGEQGPGPTILPGNRGGRPRREPGATETQKRPVPAPKRRPAPELVCWREGMTWAVGVEVPEELVGAGAKVTQAQLLEEDPIVLGRYPLVDPLGKVSVCWSSGDATAEFDAESFRIFKLAGNLETGRRVARLTRGRFLVMAPGDWQCDEGVSEPVKPEPVARSDFLLAHHFDIVGSEVTKAAFIKPDGTQVQVLSAASGLALDGCPVQLADPDVGPLFLRDPPMLTGGPYATVVVGEEGASRGGRRWRSSAEKFDVLHQRIKNRGIGWFFLRVYDEEDRLLDSFDFRYARDLTAIEVDQGSPMPALNGHAPVSVRFRHAGSYRVGLLTSHSGVKVEARDGETQAVIPADPTSDETRWRLGTADRSLDFTLCVERVWWATSEEGCGQDPEWTDQPLTLAERDLAPTSRRTLVVRLPKAGWASEIRVGFAEDSAYRATTSPRRREYVVALRNLGGHLPKGTGTRGVRLKLWVVRRGSAEPSKHEAEVARVAIESDLCDLDLRSFHAPRLMTLLARLRHSLPGATRSPIKELRSEYYRPARRGTTEQRCTFVRQALCLLAVLLELPETAEVAGRGLKQTLKQRSETARERYPADVDAWKSRLSKPLRRHAGAGG